MRYKKFIILAVFFLMLLFFAETEAANLFFNSLGPDAGNSASGFTLSYGPTDYSATFQGQISNFPIGERGVIGAFIFAAGREMCIGLSTIDSSKKYKMQIFGDDPVTQKIEGAKDGDLITFKAIISGELAPLVLIDGSASPIWKNNQILFDVNLNIEKAGIEGPLKDILLGGLGAVGSGGMPPAELTTLSGSPETGGFGVIPEPATLIIFIIGLGFILTKVKNI